MANINIELLERIKALDPFNNPEIYSLTDLGISKLFADVNAGKALFNKTADSWFVYEGIKWEKDQGDLKVDGYAKEFATAYQLYLYEQEAVLDAKKLSSKERKEELERLRYHQEYCALLGGRSHRKTIIEDARSYVPATQEEFDTQPNLFNCLNGVIDLNTGKLLPHSSDMMLSKVANVQYDAAAKCTRFYRFMEDIEPPESVRKATDEYRDHSDKISLFLNDFTSEKTSFTYSCKELYENYVVWCRDNNFSGDGKLSFMNEIRKRSGFRERATINGNTVRNAFSIEQTD